MPKKQSTLGLKMTAGLLEVTIEEDIQVYARSTSHMHKLAGIF